MNLILQPTIKTFFKKKQLLLRFCFFTLLALSVPKNVEASHYRYGSISWSRPDDASRVVTFKITTAWRISYFVSGPTTVGSVVDPAIGLFAFGDGSTTNVTFVVTSRNVADDWLVAERTVTHTYPAAAGNDLTASFSSNARFNGPALQNNNNGSFRSIAQVKLVTGNTGSPVSTLPAIINLAVGQSAATFNVPATDPDAQSITYTLASPSQTLGTNPSGLSINSSTGVATFNTVGKAVNQLWNGAFALTDASGSITLVDFLIKIVAANTPPIFDYSITPADNFVYSINPGQTLTFSVKALDVDAGSTVTLTAVGQPTGVSFSPALPAGPSNPVTVGFSFTPTAAQLGIYVITFVAERNGGVQTNTSVTINVNTNPIFLLPTKLELETYVIPTGASHLDTIVATNPDVNVSTQIFTASIPSGATLSASTPTSLTDTTTMTMSWTPTAANFGPHTVSFTAKDGNGKTTTRQYILFPNSIPSFGSTPGTIAHENEVYTYNIVLNDDDYAYGDMLEINSSSVPSWLTLTDNGDGTATLTGTPGSGDIGDVTIILSGEDLWHHAHAAVEQTFTITVVQCNVALSLSMTNTSCPKGTDGTASVSYTGNGAHFSILWNTTATTSEITGLAPGKYYVTVTNEFNCWATDTIIVGADADITAPSITCPANISVSNTTGRCDANVTVSAPTLSDNCSLVCYTEDFEAYSTDSISGLSPQWVIWPGGLSGVVSTDYYNSAENSLKITGNASGGPTDQLFLLGNQTSGNWDLSFKIYIPAGHTAYYNLQHFETAAIEWAHQVQFHSNGTGNLFASGSAAFTYPQDQWFEVKQLIDQTTNQTTLFINGVAIKSWQFSKQYSGAAGTNQIGALDFFPNTNSFGNEPNPSAIPLYYIDDIKMCGNNAPMGNYIARSLSKIYAAGTTTVDIKVTDESGNASNCSFDVTVNDTELPIAHAKNISVTLTNGSASITGEDINDMSTDNCAIESYSVSPNTFSCSNIGSNTVALTVTDVSGNTATTTAMVTVIGSLPSVSISQGVLPGFCQGGAVVLTANASSGVTYLWSTGATTQTINVYATGTYSVTVTNGFGCTSTSSTSVTYHASALFSSYTIIASSEAEFGSSSYVQSGAVGVTAAAGEIELENNSTITGSSTFAKAKYIDIHSGSSVTNKIYAPATITLPAFKNNTHYTQGNNLNVSSNATVTLNDSIYKDITVGTNATITFTKPIVYIRTLSTNTNVKIQFSNCTVLVIYNEVEFGPYTKFNLDLKSATIYARKEVEIDRGSTINAAIYSLEEIETEGTSTARVAMNGMFIANEVEGKYTSWNWNNVCVGCALNKTQPFASNPALDNEQGNDQVSLNVFPNPTTGRFNIEINSTLEGPLTITVFNYLGQEVQREVKSNFTGTASVRVDLHDAASTYYMVKVEMAGQTLYKKVVLTKM